MPSFLQQVAYSPEGWRALVANPQDRIEAVRPAIEKLGGKIHGAWFAFGDYDIVVIAEMPTNVRAQARLPWLLQLEAQLRQSRPRLC